MNRNSVQIRNLLESKRLDKSRFNHQNSINYISGTTSQIRNLKRSESSSSLRRKTNPDHSLIEERYKKLQLNYRQLFEQTKVKAQIFAKQKQQLEKYKGQKQKDKKQIQRLRSMLGFLKKKDFAVQVDSSLNVRCSVDRDIQKTSTYSKAQLSTDAGLIQSGDNWKSSKRQKSRRKDSGLKNSKIECRIQRQQTPKKLYDKLSYPNKSATFLPSYSSNGFQQKQQSKRCGLSKYKFIPTLSLN